DNSAKHAVYTGLAINGAQIYAANVAQNKVEIYDSNFKLVKSFTDKGLPKGFGPFNVAVINNQVYVAYTKTGGGKAGKAGQTPGAKLGYVDVFTTKGKLVKRLISNGKLNAPWAMAVAPSSYGTFAGSLLVGNFGNGKINAYDINTGDFLGTLKDS